MSKNRSFALDEKFTVFCYHGISCGGGLMMRILVVEDEKLLCDGIAEDLELEKYTVERCYDGAAA